MAVITIGVAAIDRGGTSGTYTIVNYGGSADGTGSIASVEIWANSDMTGCEVATFYVVSGDNLSTRATHAIGNVTSGSKQTFSGLDIAVVTGDYLGYTSSTGNIEYDSSGFDGAWGKSGDYIPCTNEAFTLYAGDAVSLYGEGETAVEGISIPVAMAHYRRMREA